MKTIVLKRLTHYVTIGVSVLACSTAANAQSYGTGTKMEEPARWMQEDVTFEQKLSTATKEAVNAQQQSLDDCKLLAAAKVTECNAEARMNYRKDMDDISKRFGAGAIVKQ